MTDFEQKLEGRLYLMKHKYKQLSQFELWQSNMSAYYLKQRENPEQTDEHQLFPFSTFPFEDGWLSCCFTKCHYRESAC